MTDTVVVQTPTETTTTTVPSAPTKEVPYLGPQGVEQALIRKPSKNPSFDELVDIHTKSTTEPKKETTNENQETQLPGRTTEQNQGETGQAEQEAKPTDEAGSEAETEAKKDIFKAKVGDTEVEIPHEAEIQQEVNGKQVKFKVKDAVTALVNQTEFNRKMESRISKLHSREQQFLGSKQGFEGNLKKVLEHAQKHDLFGLIHFAAESTGQNPVDIERTMLESYNSVMKQFEGLTQHQKDALFAERKAEYWQNKAQTVEQQTRWNQELSKLDNHITELSTQNGLTKNDFMSLYQTMMEHFVGPGKQYATADKIPPEDVITFKNRLDMVNKVEAAIKSVAPDKLSEDLVTKVLNVIQDQYDFTVQDIADILKNGSTKLVSPALESLEKKVRETEKNGFGAQSLKKPAQVNSKTKNDTRDDLYDFFVRPNRR